MNDLPIGVFDSGIGGLTVLKDLISELPKESFIYLGDTARIPYGTRSPETVTKFALELVDFLLKRKVKALVVACNTISANSLPAIKKRSSVPVVDVISTTLEAVSKLDRRRVGVIGTRGTINSGAYAAVAEFSQSCPLFVPLAEEGMTTGPTTEAIAREYLSKLKKEKIDTLILGCTHFPLLQKSIAKVMDGKVRLITSGEPTAKKLHEILAHKGLLAQKSKPRFEFYFTDAITHVGSVAERFFGKKLPGKIARIEI